MQNILFTTIIILFMAIVFLGLPWALALMGVSMHSAGEWYCEVGKNGTMQWTQYEVSKNWHKRCEPIQI